MATVAEAVLARPGCSIALGVVVFLASAAGIRAIQQEPEAFPQISNILSPPTSS